MKAKFTKFIPLKTGRVSVMLEAEDADIPELVTFLRKDVWLSQIQTEISESRTAILVSIRELSIRIAEAIEKELKNDDRKEKMIEKEIDETILYVPRKE